MEYQGSQPQRVLLSSVCSSEACIICGRICSPRKHFTRRRCHIAGSFFARLLWVLWVKYPSVHFLLLHSALKGAATRLAVNQRRCDYLGQFITLQQKVMEKHIHIHTYGRSGVTNKSSNCGRKPHVFLC